MADNTSMIAGLFMTPELYQQKQESDALAQAMKMAQLDPMQRANAMLGYGGYQAAGGLASALGVQDPMLQRISQQQQLLKNVDYTDLKSLTEGVRQAVEMGRPDIARQLAQDALELQSKTAGKQTEQQKNAAVYASTVAAPGTPEYAKAFKDKFEELTSRPEGKINYGAEADRAAKAFFGKPFSELSQEQAAAIDKTLEQRGLVKAAASRSSINMPPQEKAEQGERGKMLVDIYKDISKQAGVAARTLPALETSLNILDKGFDTGFGTEAKAAGAKVLAAFGVKDAESFATNSQAFLGAASQAVLTRQLEQKGPQTEADAARISQTGAQLGNTKEANRFLISVAKAQFKRDLAQRKFFDDWFEKNKTYDGAENAWYNGQGGKSLFEMPELQKYAAPVSPAAQIPTTSGPIYASNGKQRIVSTDGGRTWKPAQ